MWMRSRSWWKQVPKQNCRRDVACNVSLSRGTTRDNQREPAVVTLYQNKYRVESARLCDWDYRARGWYFVTICAHKHASIFGEIADGEVQLFRVGQIAKYTEPMVQLGGRTQMRRRKPLPMPSTSALPTDTCSGFPVRCGAMRGAVRRQRSGETDSPKPSAACAPSPIQGQ